MIMELKHFILFKHRKNQHKYEKVMSYENILKCSINSI